MLMKNFSLGFIAFLQALGIVVYCGFIGLVFINGNSWFGPMNSFLGPTLFLMLFVVSAIVCSLIFGAKAFLLFWEKKDTRSAIKLISYTTFWLVIFILGILSILLKFFRF